MRKTKTKVFILLLLFPMILSLGSLTTIVKGESNIPEPSPNNSWHWGVNIGDVFMFESELITTDPTTHDVINMYRNIDIYNITSIVNQTSDLYGFYPFQQVSKVIIDVLWESSVGSLSLSPLTGAPLCIFGYNETLKKEIYQIGAGGITPFIYPINDTVLDVASMASVYNETFLTPIINSMGVFNKFDSFSYDVGKTEIKFENTTHGYYFRASYYPNNGTLKDMDAYYLMKSYDWIVLNVSGKRVFNHDVTDEIEWGVNIGDELFYYVNQTGYDTYLSRLKVLGFNKAVYWSSNWTMYPMDWPMVFEEVLVEISVWNGTGWDVGPTIPLTAANNFYPMCLPLMEMGGQSGIILPTSSTVEDFLFIFNNYTADLTHWFPFDTVHYDVSGNILNFTMSQSGNGQVAVGVYNLGTGLVELQYATYLGEIQMWFELADPLVEWNVDIGDTLFFKENFNEDMQEVRYTITSIEYNFVDVTTIGFPIPTGQPKYQFFTELYGNFSVWMKDTETWYDAGTALIAAANEYWPISPYSMIGSMPLLMPEGTVVNDLQYLFNVLSVWYDDISYSPGHVIMSNTTASSEFHFYFDETTGRMTFLGGDNYAAHEWWYISAYPEFIQNLNTGTNHFVLSDNFNLEPTVTVEIEAGATAAAPDFIYALLPYNPLGISLPNGTVLFYMEHKLTGHSVIVGNITMTIQFPSSIQLSENYIYLYSFNMSGTGEWDLAPPEFYQYSVTYDLVNNRMTFEIEVTGPYMFLSAVSYEAIPEDGGGETPPIPGYDLFFLAIAMITVSAIVVKKIRKK
ncbi:MAG: hypothetical protein ACFFCV_16640 [Promethearchaeota archaeon]